MKILLSVIIFCTTILANEIKLIDKNATDPIYILPLKKYPKWLCEAELKNGKKVQFVSVKSMMQVYQHQDYFQRHKFIDDNISKIFIQDFISGRKVDATKAIYLFGSRLVGPHGDDLIPFENKNNAKIFMMKNGGTKILPFTRLKKGLIKYLDM